MSTPPPKSQNSTQCGAIAHACQSLRPLQPCVCGTAFVHTDIRSRIQFCVLICSRTWFLYAWILRQIEHHRGAPFLALYSSFASFMVQLTQGLLSLWSLECIQVSPIDHTVDDQSSHLCLSNRRN